MHFPAAIVAILAATLAFAVADAQILPRQEDTANVSVDSLGVSANTASMTSTMGSSSTASTSMTTSMTTSMSGQGSTSTSNSGTAMTTTAGLLAGVGGVAGGENNQGEGAAADPATAVSTGPASTGAAAAMHTLGVGKWAAGVGMGAVIGAAGLVL